MIRTEMGLVGLSALKFSTQSDWLLKVVALLLQNIHARKYVVLLFSNVSLAYAAIGVVALVTIAHDTPSPA